jgi:hypothetical protein
MMVSGQCGKRTLLRALCPVQMVYEIVFLEKGRKSLRQEEQPEPAFHD